MILVKQTKFGKGEGNCFPACLASVLELSLEEVPEIRGENWISDTNKFRRNLDSATWSSNHDRSGTLWGTT